MKFSTEKSRIHVSLFTVKTKKTTRQIITMKKHIALSQTQSHCVLKILLREIKPFLPTSHNHLRMKVSSDTKDAVQKGVRQLIQQEVEDRQELNKTPDFKKSFLTLLKTTTMDALLLKYLELLYLYDRSSYTVDEMKTYLPLFEKNKDHHSVYKIELTLLHTLGENFKKGDMTNENVGSPIPLAEKMMRNKANQGTATQRFLNVMTPLWSFVQLSAPLNDRLSIWRDLIQSNLLFPHFKKLIESGKYQNGPLDRTLPEGQKLNYLLYECFDSQQCSPQQNALLKLLCKKQVNIPWIPTFLMGPYFENISDTGEFSSTQQYKLRSDIKVLKDNGMHTALTCLLELFLYRRDEILAHTSRDIRLVLDKDAIDLSFTPRPAHMKEYISGFSNTIHDLLRKELGISALRNKNYAQAISWFSETIQFQERVFHKANDDDLEILSSIFSTTNDALSNFALQKRYHRVFGIEDLLNIQLISNALQHKYPEDSHISTRFEGSYEVKYRKNTPYIVSSIQFGDTESVLIINQNDIKDYLHKMSYDEHTSKDPSTLNISPPTSKQTHVIDDRKSLGFHIEETAQKGPKVKTRKSPSKANQKEEEPNPQHTPSLASIEFLNFLAEELNAISLRNITSKDIFRFARKRSNYLRTETGNHPIAVFRTHNGGEARIPIPGHHSKTVKVGTVKSVFSQIISTLSPNYDGLSN